MFTGIVTGKATVREVKESPGLRTLVFAFPAGALTELQIGASVAIDGVCLTVTGFEGDSASFDVMMETLRCTTLGELSVSDEVNFERSARANVEVGGHILSGHVDGLAEIINVERPENNCVLTFRVEPQWMKYIYQKGYIALGGASLTVAEPDKSVGTFRVYLIPETLRLTTFDSKKVGDKVNFEIERQTQVMVDTVENFLEERLEEIVSRQVREEFSKMKDLASS